MTSEDTPPPKTLSTPKLIGVLIGAWFVPQVVALFVVPGVAEDSFETVGGLVQWEIVSKLGTALIAIWVIVHLRWVDDVRHERWPTERWVAIVPIGMIVVAVATTDYVNLADAGIGFVLLLVVGTFATGLNEELLFRGIALRSMRDRHREWVAAAFSSILFGSFHLVNIVFAGGAAVFQAIWAILAGYLLYLCRRVGGGMALPIVVHWIWDFSSFSPVLRNPDALAGGRYFLQFLTTFVLMIIVVIRRRSIPASPDVSTLEA
ncbi:CPBP family intramembrane glutamic endopeptidase [Ilumatobacter nonamiensis]|uniref:CPBP family intramembrane glutamic endopeptidase n=1 Tax=Ilumatobacter nonamiensis TaxID=467093 RepID=UPI00034A5BF9|nr:CPBP family intramembrane glutamic endopeptidase [Ilumatobacter nonamiensis]